MPRSSLKFDGSDKLVGDLKTWKTHFSVYERAPSGLAERAIRSGQLALWECAGRGLAESGNLRYRIGSLYLGCFSWKLSSPK